MVIWLILQERHRAEAVSFGYGGALSLPTPQPAPRSSTSGNATTVSIGGVNNVNNTSDNNANNLTNNNASNVFTDNHGASSFHPFNTQERSVAFPTSVTTDPSSSSLLSEPVYEVGKKAILPSFECHMWHCFIWSNLSHHSPLGKLWHYFSVMKCMTSFFNRKKYDKSF